MEPLLNGTTSGEESQLAEEEEEVDPRIQGELEKLNQSTDDINRLETELEEFRQRFRAVLVEATVKLDEQVKKIGRAVDDSKPYWEARKVTRQAQLEAQKATQEFQRAVEILRAAKETIALAEERLLEEDSRHFDSAWQEMLNHATQRVMEAEQSRVHSEAEHKKTAVKHDMCVSHMKQVEKKVKRSISKSKPYFELKAKYYLQLQELKRHVDERQAKLGAAKAEYRAALRSLESISEEIHAQRRSVAMGTRERGVGSEGDGEDVDSFKMDSDGLSSEWLQCLFLLFLTFMIVGTQWCRCQWMTLTVAAQRRTPPPRPPSPPRLVLAPWRSYPARVALTAQTHCVLVGMARHSWALGANAAGRPLQTATRREGSEQRRRQSFTRLSHQHRKQ